MNRRQALRLVGSAAAGGALAAIAVRRARGQSQREYTILGSGPTVLAFDRMPAGYYQALSSRYRVVVMDYPPADASPQFVDSFTADRVCADILAVADSVAASRFAWYGFSWGAVVGLQLAVRTDRLTALACGGWPPLGGQYEETLAAAETAQGAARVYATYYRSLRGWREREAVTQLTCPRLVFAGSNDQFVAQGRTIRIGPLVAEHRDELRRLGWTVRLIDGFGHELGGRPDVVTPVLREFLDPVLRRG